MTHFVNFVNPGTYLLLDEVGLHAGPLRLLELQRERGLAVVRRSLQLRESVDEVVGGRGEGLQQESVDPVDGERGGDVFVHHVESLALLGEICKSLGPFR